MQRTNASKARRSRVCHSFIQNHIGPGELHANWIAGRKPKERRLVAYSRGKLNEYAVAEEEVRARAPKHLHLAALLSTLGAFY